MTQIIRTNAKTRSTLFRQAKRTGVVAVVGTSATGFALATTYGPGYATITGKKIKTGKAAVAKAAALFGKNPVPVLKGTALPA